MDAGQRNQGPQDQSQTNKRRLWIGGTGAGAIILTLFGTWLLGGAPPPDEMVAEFQAKSAVREYYEAIGQEKFDDAEDYLSQHGLDEADKEEQQGSLAALKKDGVVDADVTIQSATPVRQDKVKVYTSVILNDAQSPEHCFEVDWTVIDRGEWKLDEQIVTPVEVTPENESDCKESDKDKAGPVGGADPPPQEPTMPLEPTMSLESTMSLEPTMTVKEQPTLDEDQDTCVDASGGAISSKEQQVCDAVTNYYEALGDGHREKDQGHFGKARTHFRKAYSYFGPKVEGQLGERPVWINQKMSDETSELTVRKVTPTASKVPVTAWVEFRTVEEGTERHFGGSWQLEKLRQQDTGSKEWKLQTPEIKEVKGDSSDP